MKALFVLTFLFATSSTTLSQDRNELLLKAIERGEKEAVVKLLDEGADVNYVKEIGPWFKTNPLITSITRKQFDISGILIERKADVNWIDGFKTSAIIYAASAGNKELVELLLANGADINVIDAQGNTVLKAAKESKNKELLKFVKARTTAP